MALGNELLARLRQQTQSYGVPITSSRITELIRKGTDFVAAHDGGKVSARSVLLASGIVDVHPEMHELDKAIKHGAVRYCPVCDGFEALDRKISVSGNSEDATSKAKFLRTYSKDVTLLWQHKNACTDVVFRHNFAVEGLKLDRMGIHASVGDRGLRFDMIYPALGYDVRSDLACELGAATTEIGGLKSTNASARPLRDFLRPAPWHPTGTNSLLRLVTLPLRLLTFTSACRTT